MSKLRLKNDHDKDNEYFTGDIGGDRCCNLCGLGLRNYADVPMRSQWLEFVTSKSDPGGNNVWDIGSTGLLEGVHHSFDSDLRDWFAASYRRGERYMTIYHSTSMVRYARR